LSQQALDLRSAEAVFGQFGGVPGGGVASGSGAKLSGV
jgi:hypothetical protein